MARTMNSREKEKKTFCRQLLEIPMGSAAVKLSILPKQFVATIDCPYFNADSLSKTNCIVCESGSCSL